MLLSLAVAVALLAGIAAVVCHRVAASAKPPISMWDFPWMWRYLSKHTRAQLAHVHMWITERLVRPARLRLLKRGFNLQPVAADEITSAFLTRMLRQAGHDCEVTAFELKKCGVGAFSTVYRCTLTYSAASKAPGPAAVIVKALPENDQMRHMCFMGDVVYNENKFYTTLGKQLGSNHVARCYYTSPLSSCTLFGYSMIILEDMHLIPNVYFGGTMQDANAPQAERVEYMKRVLPGLAEMHAKFWNSKDPAITSLEERHFDKTAKQHVALREYWTRTKQVVPRQYLSDDLIILGDELIRHRKALADHVHRKSSHYTFVHQDPHADNTFSTPDRPCMLIDWQIYGKGPATLDIAYMMCVVLDGEARREHEQQLLRCYYDALVRAGVDGYSLQQLQEEYRAALAATFLALYTVAGAFLPPTHPRYDYCMRMYRDMQLSAKEHRLLDLVQELSVA